MSERRYTEEEVAAIFERAIQAQQQNATPQLTSGEGMTLGQLQEVGREIGLTPEQLAGAARAVERSGRSTSRKFLGFTIAVGRTVELDRKISDDEWERLVVDLRETFDAKGKLSSEGNFKQWTNGNLQALLEPTPSGHRLRLKTMKGDSRALLTAGLGMLITSVFLGAAAAFFWIPSGGEGLDTFTSAFIIGIGMLAAGVLRLPGWARLRRQQMEDVAARLTESTSTPR